MNVICYIDGFNLYHGLRSKGWRKYYWLDLWALAERFLKPGQTLVEVVYCTTLIKDDPSGQQRQLTFIDALKAHRPGIKVVYGHYLAKDQRCFKCGNTYTRHEEKMTDVNIAVELLRDAHDDAFDTALVVSADSDLAPPVEAVVTRFPAKRVIVIAPPDRQSKKLESVASASFRLGRKTLQDSQLPDEYTKPDGYVLRRPPSWK